MMKKSNIFRKIAFILLLSLLLSIFSGSAAVAAPEVETVRDILRNAYVDVLSEEQLSYSSADEIIKNLNDPYTEIFDMENMALFVNSVEGQYSGIGAYLSLMEDGSLLILEVYEGSSAAKAGIKAGDIIIAVNGNSLSEMVDNAAVSRLFYEAQSAGSINLTVLHDDKPAEFTLAITSFQIPIVRSLMMEDNILYVELTSFSQNMAQIFTQELQRYENISGLILDLRGNGGGYLEECIKLADDFFGGGILMWYQSRDYPLSPVYFNNNEIKYDIPMVFLVDDYTASASEVFAGAVQDYQKGLLIGQKTYGKLCGQSVVMVGSEDYLKFTSNYVLTPKKIAYNTIGITPDLIITDGSEISSGLTLLKEAVAGKPDFAHILSMNIDTKEGFIDVKKAFSGQARLIQNRLYLPLDYSAALVGNCSIGWDQKNNCFTWNRNNSVQLLPMEELVYDDNNYYISAARLGSLLSGKITFDPQSRHSLLYWN
ncbi:MAG: PDZ domain-containing protein [Syntrophomonadaceae bacterium]|jgi:carboxyl-terminal processing protease|nr:PDZ domain-containing protein [Syntrophomonadaceae bacterium]